MKPSLWGWLLMILKKGRPFETAPFLLVKGVLKDCFHKKLD
jgi:hypothetical protein